MNARMNKAEHCHLYLTSPEVIGGSYAGGQMDEVSKGPGEDPVAHGITNCVLALGPGQTKGKGREESYQWKAPR